MLSAGDLLCSRRHALFCAVIRYALTDMGGGVNPCYPQPTFEFNYATYRWKSQRIIREERRRIIRSEREACEVFPGPNYAGRALADVPGEIHAVVCGSMSVAWLTDDHAGIRSCSL